MKLPRLMEVLRLTNPGKGQDLDYYLMMTQESYTDANLIKETLKSVS